MNYTKLNQGCTVRFNGSILVVTTKFDYYGRPSSIIWSSSNGSEWIPKSIFPFGRGVTNMVVLNGKLWALSIGGEGSFYQANTSANGGSTWDLVPSRIPFYGRSPIDVVVFNNKIFVYGEYNYSLSDDHGSKVFSSFDGINWISENIRGLPMDRYAVLFSGTPPVAFKDTLYFFSPADYLTGTPHGIFKSTNGRDWSRVSGATPNNLNPTEDLPITSHQSVVVHDNKVWITGGRDTGSDPSFSNDIWYSGEMKNWRKYTGYVSFKPISWATLLSHNNEMLLLGGVYKLGSGRAVTSNYVWSIKPKSTYRIPGVEIPRDRPTIPRF